LAVFAALAGACSDSQRATPSPPTSSDSIDPTPVVAFVTGVEAPLPGARPSQFVGVTADGALLVVEASTGGVVRELSRKADPRVPHIGEGPSPNSIRDVALSLDGKTVYFTEGPEPACGTVREVPVAGGVPESVGDGSFVTSGPGDHFVTSGTCGVRIRHGGKVIATLGAADSGIDNGSPAWSADGRLVAVGGRGYKGQSFMSAFDLVAGAGFEIRQRGAGVFRLPAFRNDGRLVAVQGDAGRVVRVDDSTVVASFEYGGEVVDQGYDATGTWLLATLADGTVRWFGGGDQGDLGTGYIAADW